MPSLDCSIIDKVLSGKEEKYNTFVETGTAGGETTFAMEKHFDYVHTIEVYEPFYTSTKNRYNGDKIKFHFGDSSIVLESILPTLHTNAIFFLDGHYSGNLTGFGAKHVPLYEELTLIIKMFSEKAIIIIDDYRIFNRMDGVCDWTNINKETCLSIVADRLENVYHLPSIYHPEDRLVLEINKIKQ